MSVLFRNVDLSQLIEINCYNFYEHLTKNLLIDNPK